MNSDDAIMVRVRAGGATDLSSNATRRSWRQNDHPVGQKDGLFDVVGRAAPTTALAPTIRRATLADRPG